MQLWFPVNPCNSIHAANKAIFPVEIAGSKQHFDSANLHEKLLIPKSCNPPTRKTKLYIQIPDHDPTNLKGEN